MLMIFFFIMPGVMAGLGNLLVPIQLCVPEMMFPKVNNLGIDRGSSARAAPADAPIRYLLQTIPSHYTVWMALRSYSTLHLAS